MNVKTANVKARTDLTAHFFCESVAMLVCMPSPPARIPDSGFTAGSSNMVDSESDENRMHTCPVLEPTLTEPDDLRTWLTWRQNPGLDVRHCDRITCTVLLTV